MNTKATKIKLILTIIFAAGFILNGIFITIYNVDRSTNIGLVSDSAEEIRYRNNKIVGKISQMDSLMRCEEESEDLGLSSAGLVLYFDTADFVASAR